MTSWCMQFTFVDKREVYLLDESALSMAEKESMQKGKRSIVPRMKYLSLVPKSELHASWCYDGVILKGAK